MLVSGGELGNSSASSATCMAPHWPRLKQLFLNTVLTPVSRKLIKPLEGRFDNYRFTVSFVDTWTAKSTQSTAPAPV
jgi:hypothetical protein